MSLHDDPRLALMPVEHDAASEWAMREQHERGLIDAARSTLMRRNGLAESEAQELLQRAATNQGRQVIDIARCLLTAAHYRARREPSGVLDGRPPS